MRRNVDLTQNESLQKHQNISLFTSSIKPIISCVPKWEVEFLLTIIELEFILSVKNKKIQL